MCREQLHILSSSGDNVCRVRQNVPLRMHILSPTTNCVGATKCAVTRSEVAKLCYFGPVPLSTTQFYDAYDRGVRPAC